MIFLTTTKLAEKLELDSKKLFTQLNERGWIERKDKKWILTTLGIEKGGQTRSTPETGEFIVWPENTPIVFELPSKEQFPYELINADVNLQESSEGEDYIAEYFDSIDMEYREQHVIPGLNDKYAGYRVADFYLPKYKVMVEFAGRWNRSEEERLRYTHKKAVYESNDIPCVWIYPDNLGILHYIFHKRLEVVMGTHKLEKALFRYRLAQFWNADSTNFVGIMFGLFLLFYGVTPWEENTGGVWISLGIIVYNLYRIIGDLNSILKGRSLEISRLNKWED